MNNWLRLRLMLLVLLVFGAIFSFVILLREQNRKLTVAFLNIGQGDAIFIESPAGNQMLIDGGPGKSVLRELSKVIPFYDRSIDAVMESHPDADHIGGLPDVFQDYKVSVFIEPGVHSSTTIDNEVEKDAAKEPSKEILARRGQVIDLGGGAKLEILWPITDTTGMETNVASIVTKLVYGQSEFLFTGDSPTSVEDYLINTYCQRRSLTPPKCPILESDVLKAGHHGSKTSTSPEYVAAVRPQYAVISVGRNNRYGHPNQETLDTLEKSGAKILRTDQQGRIIFESDGVNLKIK